MPLKYNLIFNLYFLHLLFLPFNFKYLKGMGITLSFFVYLLPLVLDLKLLLFSCSIMSDSLRPHELQQARLPCLHYLLEFAQTHAIELMNPSNCLILCCLLLLLPSIFPSIRVFQWVGSLHQVAKALNFSINPSSEYSGLISFRIDWFELAIQGTLKSFLQHSSKASILWHSDFFMIQLSHPYITTGKIIVLTDDLQWSLNKYCLSDGMIFLHSFSFIFYIFYSQKSNDFA